MEWTEILLFLHVVAAMAWVGGGVLAGALAGRMKTADPVHRLGYARMMEKVATFLFMPAALVVLGAGVWLVVEVDAFEFEQAWISIGFAAVLLAGAMGPLFFKPTIARGIAAMEAGDGPAAGALMRRLGVGSKVALLIEFVAVWAMTVKPGL